MEHPLQLLARDIHSAARRRFYESTLGKWVDNYLLARDMRPLRKRADAGSKEWKDDVMVVFLRRWQGRQMLADAMLVPLRKQMDTIEVPEGHLLISTAELERIAGENSRLCAKITELQQHATLREEQLRAYRRLELPQTQIDKLKADLEATTEKVLASYGLKPMHEIPLPRVSNGA